MAKQTLKKREKWPRVRPTVNNGVAYFMVDGRYSGKGQRHFCTTKAEADAKADQLRIARKNEGLAGVAIPEKLRIEALEAQRTLATVGATISEAVAYFMRHAKPAGGHKKVSEFVAEFLQGKQEEGVRPEYHRILKSCLDDFAEAFGELHLHEVTHVKVKEWLLAKPWALRTRRNRQRDLANVFNAAVREGYCAENPILKLGTPKFEEPAPGILTVEQGKKLLEVASEQEGGKLLAFVAIGLFAGLRTAELEQLDWSKVDIEHGTLEVIAKVAKTRSRRIVTMSENLKAWLLKVENRTGLVTPQPYERAFMRLRKAAGIDVWPHNAARHSFASYHLEKHQNAATTALQMGHSNTTQLFASYRELVKPRDAEAWWQL